MATYVMNMQVNYPPSFVAEFVVGNKPYDFQSNFQSYVGQRFDTVSRAIVYQSNIYNSADTNNPTPYGLWDGQTFYAPGGSYFGAGEELAFWVATLNIDTGAVAFFNAYDPTKTVPVGCGGGGIQTLTITPGSGYTSAVYYNIPLKGGHGIGNATITVSGTGVVNNVSINYSVGYHPGDVVVAYSDSFMGGGSGFSFTVNTCDINSDGTWRRSVDSSGAAIPQFVDQRTGNTWLHMDSFNGSNVCSITLLRRQDEFAKIISPLQPFYSGVHMEPKGFTQKYFYVCEDGAQLVSGGQRLYSLTLTPREITATEIAYDYLLPYANYLFPSDFITMHYPDPNVYCFTQNQTSYWVRMNTGSFAPVPGGARSYELFRFDEPTSAAFGGPVVGGGFTNITPWSSTTGPNTNAAPYAYNNTGGADFNYPYTDFMFYLPVTNQLVLLSLFPSWQTDPNDPPVEDPTLTFYDCTYYDIATGNFDYHHAFMTGYMTADWQTTTNPALAAWVIIYATQINQYQQLTDYVVPGVDYSKQWFTMVVQRFSGGTFTVNKNLWANVLVQYQFVYGSPPALIQVIPGMNSIPEDEWDNVPAYAAYATAIGSPNIVWNSYGYQSSGYLNDSGLYDPTTDWFWYGGGDPTENRYFAPIYTEGTWVSDPFMRISFAPVGGPGGGGPGRLAAVRVNLVRRPR